MKKYMGYTTVLAFVLAVIAITYYNFKLNNTIIVSAILLIFTFIVLFEIKDIDAKTMAAVSTLSAIGAASRVPFAAIPGFQPTTFIVAVSGYALGPVSGFMVGTMSAFISNFFLGQGPWTLWQMLGWGLCGFFFGILKTIVRKVNLTVFIVLCGLWGYIYGVILDMWYVVAFVKPLDLRAVAAGIAMSFYFDTLHALGNILFCCLFGKNFIKVLERYNKRYTVEYLKQ